MKLSTLSLLVFFVILLSCEKPEVRPVPGDILVYPNPAQSQFYIQVYNPGPGPYDLKIYNVDGSLMRTESLGQGQKTLQVDIQNSPRGKINVLLKRSDGISHIEVLKL